MNKNQNIYNKIKIYTRMSYKCVICYATSG